MQIQPHSSNSSLTRLAQAWAGADEECRGGPQRTTSQTAIVLARNCALPVATGAVAALSMWHLMKMHREGQSEGVFGWLKVAALMYPGLKSSFDAIEEGYRTALSHGTMHEMDVLRNVFSALEGTAAAYLGDPAVPEQNKVTYRKERSAILTLLGSGNRDDGTVEKLAYEMEEYCWNRCIPRGAKNVSHMRRTDDQGARKRIDDQVMRRLMTQPPSHHESLQSWITGVRNGYSDEAEFRDILYLHGQPGVGKNRFIEGIARDLELPLIKVVLGKDSMGAVLKEDGRPFHYFREAGKPLTANIGEFAKQVIECGYTNPIVFFDEFGDGAETEQARLALLEGLKQQSDSKHFSIATMGSVIPNKFNIVVASNNAYKLEDVPEHKKASVAAVLERMRTLQMPPLTDEIFAKIADEECFKAIERLKGMHNDYKPVADLRDVIRDACLEENKRLEMAGARVLKSVIQSVFMNVFQSKYDRDYDDKSMGREITADQIKATVAVRFSEKVTERKGLHAV